MRKSAQQPARRVFCYDAGMAPLLRVISGAYAAILVLFSCFSEEMYFGPEVFLVAVYAGGMALLLHELLKHRCFGAAVYSVVLSIAFLFGAQGALHEGFTHSVLPVGPEEAAYGLLSALGFGSLVCIGAAFLSRTVAVRALAGASVRTAEVAGSEVFMGAFLALFCLAGFVAVLTGRWSFYGVGQRDDVVSGGFRLEMYYSVLLVVVVALSMGRAFRARGASRFVWGGALLGALLLMFVLQSRRAMVTSILLGLVVVFAEMQRLPQPVRFGRLMAWGGAASLVVLGGMWLTPLWRAASSGSETLDEQLSATGDLLSEESAADDPMQSTAARFTYLWLDAAMWQYFRDPPSVYSVQEVLWGDLAGVLPGAIYPGKYRVSRIQCETQFARLNVDIDLPCTPHVSAWVTMRWAGVLAVWLTMTFSVAFLEALLRRGQSGLLLGGVLLATMCDLESTSTFTVFSVMRAWVTIQVFTLPLCLLAMLVGVRAERHDVQHPRGQRVPGA